MCQISNIKRDKVRELRVPMTVYKIVEQDPRDSSRIRSFYKLKRITIGETANVQSFRKFKRAIKWKIDNSNLVSQFKVEGEGIHAYPNIDAVNNAVIRSRAACDWNLAILECEIPAWSGVINGTWSDRKEVLTLVTNRIKYVRIIKL